MVPAHRPDAVRAAHIDDVAGTTVRAATPEDARTLFPLDALTALWGRTAAPVQPQPAPVAAAPAPQPVEAPDLAVAA
ncbi:hypothetical protein D9M72_613370 [compost metagenome]